MPNKTRNSYVYDGERFPEMAGGPVVLADLAACAGIGERVIRARVRARRAASDPNFNVRESVESGDALVIKDSDLNAASRGTGSKGCGSRKSPTTHHRSVLYRGERHWSTSMLLSRRLVG